MKPDDIVIGKTYRIRLWEDITQNAKRATYTTHEEWVDPDDDPEDPLSQVFVPSMRSLCGRSFTVNYIEDEFDIVRSEEGVEEYRGEGMYWCISPWMLEEFEEEQLAEPDRDLFGFLFQLENEPGGDFAS